MNTGLKRITDVLLATVGLILAIPIMLVIIALLRLEEAGNPIFSQQRLGKGGKLFFIHKFRKFPLHWGNSGPGVTVAGDARMTPVGVILERTKLDELPQLWNILKGEMSFVGPRPESLRYADLFQGEFSEVLNFIPGIFGPNQVEFRNESSMYPAHEDPEDFYRRELFPRKALNDIHYFTKASWIGDLAWIIKGVLASFLGVIEWRSFMGFHAKILIVDYILIQLAWVLMYLVRFQEFIFEEIPENYLLGQFICPFLIIFGMFVGQCYRNPVRYFSFVDAKHLAVVVAVTWSFAFILLLGLVDRDFSLSFWPLGLIGLVVILALPRILARSKWEREHWSNQRNSRGSGLLIYGAGKRGSALAVLVKYGMTQIHIQGFIDDDPMLSGTRVLGYPVYGRESDIPTIAEVYDIREVWTSFIPDETKRLRLKALCAKAGLALEIIPEREPFSRDPRLKIMDDVAEIF